MVQHLFEIQILHKKKKKRYIKKKDYSTNIMEHNLKSNEHQCAACLWLI